MSEPNSNERETVNERRFRRYHKQAERRRRQAREDTRFFSAVFSLAGVAGAIAIGIAVFGMTGGGMSPGSLANLTQPWIGPLSKFEVLGLIFIALLGALYFWRIRKR